MRYLSSLLIAFFLFSCSSSTQDETNTKDTSIPDTKHIAVPDTANALTEFEEVKLDLCKTVPVTLDTTTNLQNQFFEPETDLLGYKTVAVHVSSGDGEMGYVILSKNTNLVMGLIDYQEGYKIIGTTKIPTLRDNEAFVDFCESSCSNQFKTFGVVKELQYGDVKTIRAWRVNNETRQLEEITPSSVNCREAFYTDYE